MRFSFRNRRAEVRVRISFLFPAAFSLRKNHQRAIVATMVMALAALTGGRAAAAAMESREPEAFIRAYLQALYARDFSVVYHYVSSQDQRARSLDDYLRAQGPLSGFALQVARSLAAITQIEILASEEAATGRRITVRYTVPDPEKIAPLVHQWNGYQLNSLSGAQRQQLMQSIDALQRQNAIPMTTGEETITLIKEGDQWRVFLDWGRGMALSFRALLGGLAGILKVEITPAQLTSRPGAIFDVILKITNYGQKPSAVRIAHLVQPQALANYLEIIQCGFLLPLRLEPGAEREYSATYLLSGRLPAQVKEIRLDFDFRSLSD
jgi:hypothetical protein